MLLCSSWEKQGPGNAALPPVVVTWWSALRGVTTCTAAVDATFATNAGKHTKGEEGRLSQAVDVSCFLCLKIDGSWWVV
jgi:hypothetical protein